MASRARLLALGLLVGCQGQIGDPPPKTAIGQDASVFIPPPTPDSGPSCEGPLPGAAPVRLLTRTEYNHTVRDLLGDNSQPAQAFPVENTALGFDNNAEAHLVSPLLVSAYQDAAESVAARAVAERLGRITPCQEPTPECGRAFIAALGPKAFRRPLRTEEAALLQALFEDTLSTYDFATAVEWTLMAILQSPQFLYRIEALGESEGEFVALDGYALASRLSYFLWRSMPDATLFEAAAAGRLGTPEGLEIEARRMLADDKAKDGVNDFFRQWLSLDLLDGLTKDLGPNDPGVETLRAAWRDSMYQFLRYAVLEATDPMAALFTSSRLYLSEATAPLYGGRVSGPGLAPVDVPGERAGILTQPALMAKLAHPDQTSPIHRGIFVRERLLCQNLPPPPADLLIEPPSPDPNATTRERFAEHTNNPACAGCHQLIDPIGFGFESYDALGRYRTVENGKPVDSSGHLHNTGEPLIEGPFNDVVGLAGRLAQSQTVRRCVAQQWYRYAMGRGEAALPDTCALEQAFGKFSRAGDFRELMVALVLTDTFRLRPGMPRTEPPPLSPDPDAGVASPDAEPATDSGVPAEMGPPMEPIGNFEGISLTGLVAGWALDPNTPHYPLLVEFFVDGPPGQGTYIGAIRADIPRADVNQVTGHPGDHGFNFQLPTYLMNGQPHTLHVLAYNTGAGDHLVLPGSGLSFTLGANNRFPEGFIDNVSATGIVAGWALDRDVVPATILIHFYVDGPAGVGRFAGAIQAGTPRPDVNQALGVPGDHGYSYPLPVEYRDGQPHRVWAYGIDAQGAFNPELGNSPFSFTAQ